MSGPVCQLDQHSFSMNLIGLINFWTPASMLFYAIEKVFYVVDQICWLGRKIRILSFAVENPSLVIGGEILESQLGGSLFVQTTARVVYVARVITDCFFRADEWRRCLGRIVRATVFFSVETTYCIGGLSRSHLGRIKRGIPLSTIWPWPCSQVIQRVHMVASRVWGLMAPTGEMVYSFLEMREALRSGLFESSIRTLPLELQRMLSTLSITDAEALIEETKEVIDVIFAGAMVPWSSQRLLSTLRDMRKAGEVPEFLTYSQRHLQRVGSVLYKALV